MLRLGGALLLTLACSVTLAENPCEDGWIQMTAGTESCLFFESADEFNWDAADAYCQEEQNATLVEILTEEQFDFLLMMLGILGAENRWTGATDTGRESQWIWITTLEEVADFVWHPGFPFNGVEGNCMSLHPHDLAIDQNCTSTFKPICQKFMRPATTSTAASTSSSSMETKSSSLPPSTTAAAN
jgi:hypothetical protein